MKQFLQKLICADSTCEKGESAAAKIIAAEFTKSGINSTIDTWDSSRANIITHIKSAAGKPALLIACHLDVVPPGKEKWQYPPFDGIETNGRIFGRGSADMKGPIAAVVTAITELVDSKTELAGDLIFIATAGEETDSCGVKRFLQNVTSLPPLAGCLIPEPTDFKIVTSHRGLLWLEVKTIGKTAHGSTPNLGINAITSMTKFLEALEEYRTQKFPADCSISVNKIAAGDAVNVVPDRCTVAVDIRTTPAVTGGRVIADFEKIFKKLKQSDEKFDAEVAVLRNVPALKTDENCDFIKNFCRVVEADETISVGFCTDGAFLARLNVPVVIYGPGKSELCHKPNEYIELAELEKAASIYKTIIRSFCT